MKRILILPFLLFFSAQAYAQSGRWGIIINENSKACARFWEGNACSRVKVPDQWKAILPVWSDEKQALTLTYETKSCSLGLLSSEQCCKELGFTFDSNFRAPQEKTALSDDPRSECFQLRAADQPPTR